MYRDGRSIFSILSSSKSRWRSRILWRLPLIFATGPPFKIWPAWKELVTQCECSFLDRELTNPIRSHLIERVWLAIKQADYEASSIKDDWWSSGRQKSRYCDKKSNYVKAMNGRWKHLYKTLKAETDQEGKTMISKLLHMLWQRLDLYSCHQSSHQPRVFRSEIWLVMVN